MKGGWVFGGWERDNKTNVFVATVEDRTAETLVSILKKFVALGTIIHFDRWKAYSGLKGEGYEHFLINHNDTFVNPDIEHKKMPWKECGRSSNMGSTCPCSGMFSSSISLNIWQHSCRGKSTAVSIYSPPSCQTQPKCSGNCIKAACAYCLAS